MTPEPWHFPLYNLQDGGVSFSKAPVAIGTCPSWGMRKCCRLVDISSNNNLKNGAQGIRLDRVPEELGKEVCKAIQETVTKTISKKKKCKKAKWLSEGALQIVEKRREAKGKGERERYTKLNVEFQRMARKDRKVFLSEQCKEIEENNRMGRLKISSRKLEISRAYFVRRACNFLGSVLPQQNFEATDRSVL